MLVFVLLSFLRLVLVLLLRRRLLLFSSLSVSFLSLSFSRALYVHMYILHEFLFQ